MSIGIFSWKWWRPAAAALLVGNLLAYVVYIAQGRETVDEVGMACKLLELATLAVICWPKPSQSGPSSRSLRWISAAGLVVVLTLFTGAISWAVELRPQPHLSTSVTGTSAATTPSMDSRHASGLGMIMETVPDRPPTLVEQRAAANLVASTRAGTVKYQDVSVALADGYRPSTPDRAATVHYTNSKFMRDGLILDPSRPETLVYAITRHGAELLGAMY